MARAFHPATLRDPERALPLERFERINRERLKRARDCLSPRRQDFLEILPFLFHTNYPQLPGFVSTQTPSGIHGYVPEPATLGVARRLARGFNVTKRALQRYELLGIYFMGSSGTVAHSDHSDFDVWVCHAGGLAESAVEELRQKAAAIEAWAAGLGLEVHFFIFDPESFRTGESQRLSSESSGSTQHYLLLDEFYRSGLVVAGIMPLWMQIPPEHESEYDVWAERLKAEHAAQDVPVVDFGGLSRVPAEEFFGATVWQLYKSIGAPYKSVLKLLLMETYAAEYPDIDLLSLRYKRAVYSGETRLDELDPYLLMYRKVEEYLMARNDASRLNLLRRCFYLKVNERLSEPAPARVLGWRRDLLRFMTESWGWDEGQIALLDSKDSWRFHTVRDESRELVAALTSSYRMLSQFARRQTADSRITQADLNTLGRKLYAAFERKAGKVELVNRGITPDLIEPRVSIHQLGGAGGEENWVLFQDKVMPEDLGSATPIKRGRSLLDVLAWCHFNKVVDSRTVITLHSQSTTLTTREVKAMLDALEQLLPGGTVAEATAQGLNRAPVIQTAGLFINVGLDPMKCRLREGQHLATGRNNALSYGGQHENLALTFDLIIATSWEEVFTYRYTGQTALVDCLGECLRWAAAGHQPAPPAVSTHCYSSSYGGAITRRIQELFQDVAATFHTNPERSRRRYVIEAGGAFQVLSCSDGAPAAEFLPGHAALLRYLARPLPAFSPVAWDRYSLDDSPLPLIYAVNAPGVVQAFFHCGSHATTVYVLDELGSLFTQEASTDDRAALVEHYRRFFAALGKRRQNLAPEPEERTEALPVEIYLVREHRGSPRQLVRLPDEPRLDRGHYFNVQVIGEGSSEGHTTYTVFCNDREYSGLEYGADLFRAVAADIQAMRRSGLRYPVYITDLDLSGTLAGSRQGGRLQTVHFLQYKKTIEDRLTGHLPPAA